MATTNQKSPMKVKNPGKTLSRVLGYILHGHGVRFVIALALIILSSYASIQSMSLMEDLSLAIGVQLDGLKTIPGYQATMGGVLQVVIKMAVIFVLGIIATGVYNQLTVIISQSVLRDIRNQMFARMQRLPIECLPNNRQW